MPKDSYYIKLDTNAFTDPKIKMLRKYYGIKGFGAYIRLVLLLREEEHNDLEYGETTWESLCDELDFSPEELHQFIDDCIDKFKQKGKGLFTKKDGTFSSDRLNRDVAWLEEKREEKRLAGKVSAERRWGKPTEQVSTPSVVPVPEVDISDELRTEFSELDIDGEFKKFTLYWSEGKRKLQRPKTAFRNWLIKAREFKQEKQPAKIKSQARRTYDDGNTEGMKVE